MLSSVLQALSWLERATAPPGPQGIHHDAWVGLRPDSAAAYQAAVKHFLHWSSNQNLPLIYPSEIDRAVALYAKEAKLTRGKIETLTSALKRGMPSLKGQLHWADSHMKKLLRYAPPSHMVPMMRFVCVAVGHRMAMNGWARAGGLLILQGCTGLRSCEILGLTREDLVPGKPAVSNGNAVTALGRKQGTKAGRAQFVVVHASEDQTALALISAFVAATQPGKKLTNLNYNRFRGILDRALKDLGLSDLGYTPHSPRAGWATTLRLSGMRSTEIQERGRWQNAYLAHLFGRGGSQHGSASQDTVSFHLCRLRGT